tara:strand:+ start:569 stop:706 length:138 start_codon:yes stop_codon:yes gene_type:complete
LSRKVGAGTEKSNKQAREKTEEREKARKRMNGEGRKEEGAKQHAA